MLAPMAQGDEPRQTTDDTSPSAGLALLVVGVLALVFGLLLLMLVGLLVRDLSDVVGTPLPYVHDDPDRVEWGGLAELVAYGLAGAAVLGGLYVLAQRMLPEPGRGHLDRVIGVTGLLALAAGAAYVAIANWDLRAVAFALGAGYFAYRVARGLPLDDDEEDSSASDA
jgi:hypothetical protein